MFNSWDDFFKSLSSFSYFNQLQTFIDGEYKNHLCYPPKELIFNAFKLTPLNKVKVVVIGQDPYHNEGQAMGLAFSVNKDIVPPPSLMNIYKEIELEYHVVLDKTDGDLSYLSSQGVLLLNSILSVRSHEPMSHNNNLYQQFFIDILKELNSINRPLVYLLWGNSAKKYIRYLNNHKHLVLTSAHPSPLSANKGNWFYNNHFKLANEFLKNHGLKQINWIK